MASAPVDTWRSKLSSKYSKHDIDRWDAGLKAELKSLKQQVQNRRCFDCNAEDVTWASPKLGIFMCVTCSDVHRAAGAHITCVKNFNTYLWGPDEVCLMKAVGNRRGRQLYGDEVVNSSADKNAKVAFCTRKYGSAEVQALVKQEVDNAKASAEARLLDVQSAPQVVRLQEPARPTVGKHAPLLKAPVRSQDPGILDTSTTYATHVVKENLSLDLDDFLAQCNSVNVSPRAQATPEVDFFAAWEEVCPEPVLEAQRSGKGGEKNVQRSAANQALSPQPVGPDRKVVVTGTCRAAETTVSDLDLFADANKPANLLELDGLFAAWPAAGTVGGPAVTAKTTVPDFDLFAGWESWD